MRRILAQLYTIMIRKSKRKNLSSAVQFSIVHHEVNPIPALYKMGFFFPLKDVFLQDVTFYDEIAF